MAQSEVTFSLAQQNSKLIQAVQPSLIDVQSGVSEILAELDNLNFNSGKNLPRQSS